MWCRRCAYQQNYFVEHARLLLGKNKPHTSLCRRDETVITRLRISQSNDSLVSSVERQSTRLWSLQVSFTVKHMLLELSTAIIRHKYFSSTTLKEPFSVNVYWHRIAYSVLMVSLRIYSLTPEHAWSSHWRLHTRSNAVERRRRRRQWQRSVLSAILWRVIVRQYTVVVFHRAPGPTQPDRPFVGRRNEHLQ